MPEHWPALTLADAVRAHVLVEIAWHLDELAKAGEQDAMTSRVHDRLGRYGLGRN